MVSFSRRTPIVVVVGRDTQNASIITQIGCPRTEHGFIRAKGSEWRILQILLWKGNPGIIFVCLIIDLCLCNLIATAI